MEKLKYNNKKYRAFVMEHPLIGGPDIVPAHVRAFGNGGTSLKPPDTYCVGIPDRMHRYTHTNTGEVELWQGHLGTYWREHILRHMLDVATMYLREGK